MPVRAHDLQDLDAFLRQDAGELGAVAAGALDAGGDDRPEPGDEPDDAPVAGPDGQELLVGYVSPGFGDDGDVVFIGVRVDPGDDFQVFICHDEPALELSVACGGTRRARRPGGQTRQ